MTQDTVEKMLQEILGHLYHGRRALGMMPIQKFKGLRILLNSIEQESQNLEKQVVGIFVALDSEPKVK